MGSSQADATINVILAGATGLVGRQLLNALLNDRRTGAVHLLLRRAVLDLPGSRRLHVHHVDFAAPLPPLPPADEAYIALGTTMRAAGSRAAFRAVDVDAVLACARAAHGAGVRRLAAVSALGADARSSVFYNRVKAEAEAGLAQIGFDRLVIARPSLLVGDRDGLGQPMRLGESVMLALLRPLSYVLPRGARPIHARTVARALVRTLRDGDAASVQVLESAALQTLGA
jgi:uncharacterized protein YbjT (DUF2867 family)